MAKGKKENQMLRLGPIPIAATARSTRKGVFYCHLRRN
jgi:hypothetical protein